MGQGVMEPSGVIRVWSCQAGASSQLLIPSWVGCMGQHPQKSGQRGPKQQGHRELWAGQGASAEGDAGCPNPTVMGWRGHSSQREVITCTEIISSTPGGCTQIPPGERLEEQHSHFSGSAGPGRCEGLTLLAVPLGVHHHHCGEHHAAG